MESRTEILQNFLNLYWLRPETAVWRTLDVLQIKNIKFKKPIIDIGCGDGNFSFTNFGGKVNAAFDVYRTINKTQGFFGGIDIHNQKSFVKPQIIKKSKIKIDVGLDWKKNLLEKAKKLHIYEKLIPHNANYQLPFKENKFETVFSNTFYWMQDIEHILREAYRITTIKGKIIIFVPDKNFKKSLIYNYYLNKRYLWAKILDRGIYNNINKHCYTFNKWKSIFLRSGFRIENHSNYLSEKFVKLWNIGMRPYSPFLIEMSNKLRLNDRTKIKKRLIKEILPLLRSYVDYEMNQKSTKNCFHMFLLSKRN